MKTLQELRNLSIPLPVHTQFFSKIKDLEKRAIDMDVFLSSKNCNLQRDFVWNIEQKRELILSVFLKRPIPPLTTIALINVKDNTDIFQIIDGKQRLSTLISFYKNEFTIELEGKEYLFIELPDDYKEEYAHFNLFTFLYNEPYENSVTDELRIEWFKRINYFATPVEKEHLNKFI